jgi:hypothetical protein
LAAYVEHSHYTWWRGCGRLLAGAALLAYGIAESRGGDLWRAWPPLEMGFLAMAWTLLEWVLGQRVEVARGRLHVRTWRTTREIHVDDIEAIHRIEFPLATRWLRLSGIGPYANDAGLPHGLRIHTPNRMLRLGAQDPDAVVDALRAAKDRAASGPVGRAAAPRRRPGAAATSGAND